jgi:hypothetical protein
VLGLEVVPKRFPDNLRGFNFFRRMQDVHPAKSVSLQKWRTSNASFVAA